MSDILLKSMHFPSLDARYIVGDDSMSVEGAAADAKATGDALETKADKSDTYTKAQVDTKVGDAKSELEEAIDDLDERKAEIDGYYETFTSGQAEQIIATEAITDTEPYIYRKTGGANDVGDRVYDTLVGGSIVWNQLVKDGNFTSASNWKGGGTYGACSATFTNNVATITINDNTQTSARPNLQPQTISEPILNHKYFITVDCNPSKALASNNLAVLYGGVFFLGAVEANTWNKMSKIVNAENVAQNSGTLYTQSYVTYFDNGDTLKYRNYNTIDLTAALGSTIADYVYSLETATAGAGVAWVRKYFPGVYYGFCEPHFEHVQTSAKETVGFNQFDEDFESGDINNSGVPYANADYKRSKNFSDCLPNTVYYKYCATRLWMFFYDSEQNFIEKSSATNNTTVTTPQNARYFKVVVDKNAGEACINIHGDRDGEYEAYRKRTYPIEPKVLRGVLKLDSANRLYFDGDIYEHDGTVTRRYGIRAYQSGDESLADAITDGTNTVYKLTTPATETAEPFQSPMVVDPLGTEEFTDYGVEQGTRDVAIPVGHNSEYPADLRGKLQHLPSLSTSGDGRYVVVQTGNQMTLSPDTSLGLIAALEARVAALEGGNG